MAIQILESREVCLRTGPMASIEEAFAWVIRNLDREFTSAHGTQISIEMGTVLDGEDDGAEPVHGWFCTVRGQVEGMGHYEPIDRP